MCNSIFLIEGEIVMRKGSKLFLAGLSFGLVGALAWSHTQLIHADTDSSDSTGNVDVLVGSNKVGAAVSNDAGNNVSSVVANSKDLADVINQVGNPIDVVNSLDTDQSLASAQWDAKQAFAKYAQKTKDYIDQQSGLSSSVKINLKGQVDTIVKTTDHQIESATSTTQIMDSLYNGLLGSDVTSASNQKVKTNQTLDDVKDATGSDQALSEMNDEESKVNSLLENLSTQEQPSSKQNVKSTSNSSTSSSDNSVGSVSASESSNDNGGTDGTGASNDNSQVSGGNSGSTTSTTSPSSAGSTANSNGRSNQANDSSSNSDQNVTSFKSVKEMEQYASQHGNSSVNGKTVTTSVQEVKQDSKDGNYANSGQTWFTGDDSVDFHSENLYRVSTGQTVTVKIASYTPADSDTSAQVEFTSLQQANGSSSAGQSGNAPTATTIPQTGINASQSQLFVVAGLVGLALAGSGVVFALSSKRY